MPAEHGAEQPTDRPRLDWTGRELELTVGPVAHGGHCVSRHEGRVIFVRHALPGEIVLARVTEDAGGGFCRADALEVRSASPDRVPPPCPYAGPGRCGGCDWQHAAGPAQRRLKESDIAEQLVRLGGLSEDQAAVTVSALPVDGDVEALLGWRTRTVYARTAQGQLGFHRHRGADLEAVQSCPIAAQGVGDPASVRRAVRLGDRPGVTGVELVAPATALAHSPARAPRSSNRGRGRRAPDRVEVIDGPARVTRVVRERTFHVRADGFWQVHPGAAEAFVDAVLTMLDPQPGESALDLYAGAGLFSAFLGERVGVTGAVLGLESSRAAVSDAAANLADLPWARVRHGSVEPASARELVADLGGRVDLIVLDPPRSGAGPAVIAAVLEARPRAVAYVACDPAAFARDVRAARDLGWSLAQATAFDAFPMTHHVECIGLLLPPDHASAP